MTTQIKPLSYWATTDRKLFQVIRIENDWVYYINDSTKQEYSCLAESFLFRFVNYENS